MEILREIFPAMPEARLAARFKANEDDVDLTVREILGMPEELDDDEAIQREIESMEEATKSDGEECQTTNLKNQLICVLLNLFPKAPWSQLNQAVSLVLTDSCPDAIETRSTANVLLGNEQHGPDHHDLIDQAVNTLLTLRQLDGEVSRMPRKPRHVLRLDDISKDAINWSPIPAQNPWFVVGKPKGLTSTSAGNGNGATVINGVSSAIRSLERVTTGKDPDKELVDTYVHGTPADLQHLRNSMGTVGSQILDWRSQANTFQQNRQSATVSGNGASAAAISHHFRERELDSTARLQFVHSKVTLLEIRERQRWRRLTEPGLEIDLHGLTVSEALVVARIVLRHWDHVRMTFEGRDRSNSLHFVTGRGVHSRNRQSKLFPAVKTYLRNHRWKFHEDVQQGWLEVTGRARG